MNLNDESRIGKFSRRLFLAGMSTSVMTDLRFAAAGNAADAAGPKGMLSDSAVTSRAIKRVLVFDVIETLLDLNALARQFERAFGEMGALKEFFGQMLQSAFSITVAGVYADFGAVARAALQMTAQRRNVQMTPKGMTQILSAIRTLPPHQEVRESLARLKSAGFRMAALTNSARAVLEAQVSSAGIAEYFDRLLTVDTVRQFKPAGAVYRHAAASLGVQVGDVRMIAAHSWDVGGAMQVGCAAAFVARPGMVLDPLFSRPDIVGRDLADVADQIVARDVPSGAAST